MSKRAWMMLVAAGAVGCRNQGADHRPAPTPSQTAIPLASTPHVAGAAGAAGATSHEAPPRVREGSAIARSLGSARLFVADEEHRAIQVIPAGEGEIKATAMPGPPAQVLALPGKLLVTVRDPGLLLVLRDDGGPLTELQRVALPPDAWGIGLTPDARAVVVTSPWSARVSLVGLDDGKIRWTTSTPREPRAAVVRADGAAVYITHLTSGALTRLSLEDGHATAITLPPAPLRAPLNRTLAGSLGYAATLSADGQRLLAARHAIGAVGHESWFGASTVDVLLTRDDTPLSPRYYPGALRQKSALASTLVSGSDVEQAGGVLGLITQPRALVLRRSASSVLVASEGNDELVELDSRALDPSLAVRRVYALGGEPDPGVAIATRCAAPSGIVLSEDESTAHVYCRATFSLATVPLAREDGAEPGAITHRAIASDPLDAQENRGRRLFYNARDPIVSGGLGCAGCHPEGRDDGQVWHEATFTTAAGDNANFVGLPDDVPPEAKKKGVPRRTPLLADRLGGGGPFGWRGESKDLDARLKAGFGLHRWGGIPPHEPANLDARTQLVIGFLRRGLLAPPRDAHEPTAQEQRGRELFNDGRTQCSSCHPLDAGSTTRALVPLPERPTLAGYDREGAVAYKTPSLHHLAGRAPYFHDGSAPSLEELIEKNNDRMGKTNHLDAGDRAALVAFLRSL